CVFLQASLPVRVNMIQAENGQSQLQHDEPKPKGRYTGERLKALRPETYRRVVGLLAEPHEHVSIREIYRQCHVTNDTVKAIEKREANSYSRTKRSTDGPSGSHCQCSPMIALRTRSTTR